VTGPRALLGAGALLAIAAGLVQATIGSRVPTWTGDKADPGPLGLLTVAMGVVALAASVVLTRATVRAPAQACAAGALVLIAVVGATTVGRLWIVPGPLLAVGLVAAVDDWRRLVVALRREWSRVLLVALAACVLVVILRAPPLVTVTGIAAAVALVAAAVARRRPLTMALAIAATVPFAVLGWTALVPAVVPIAAALVVLLAHPTRADSTTRIGVVR
jgi:hypothetical protein